MRHAPGKHGQVMVASPASATCRSRHNTELNEPNGDFLTMHDSELTITLDRLNAERYWQLIPAWASEHDQSIKDIAFTMGCVKHFKPRSMVEI